MIIFEMVMASKMSRWDFENSQISAQDTVGVAGDDIMFHILVLFTFILSVPMDITLSGPYSAHYITQP